MNPALLIGLSILLIGAIACFAVGAYHFLAALDDVKSGWRWVLYLFAPFALLVGSLFTEDRNYHRKKASVFLGGFVLFAGAFALLRMSA
jgi:uncharacterized membrane protein YgdD (TMEM256/DUF423 family)